MATPTQFIHDISQARPLIQMTDCTLEVNQQLARVWGMLNVKSGEYAQTPLFVLGAYLAKAVEKPSVYSLPLHS